MREIYKLFLSVTLVLCCAAAGAQVRVGGAVLDEQGNPLLGATVIEAGTTNGTTTGADGRYSIVLTGDDPILNINYLGYIQQSVGVAGRTVINISLEPEAKMLSEVVVVGYGVQKKANLTGSVSTIDFSEQTQGRPIMNVASSLDGLAAGVSVQQTSGRPGSEGTSIRVRGVGSLNNTSPLVLVDGIEWSMENINPADIETVTILKDAASTAIYGSRASHGVILITTRSGKGKPRITYNFSGVVQKPYNNLHFVSDYARHMELVNEAAENMATSTIFSQYNIDQWRAAASDPYGLNEYGVPNYVAYPNTNWFDELFHTGFSQEHNLSVSGSSDKVRYMVSAGYLDNQGVMNRWNLDSSTQKMNFRTNLEADILKWFTVGTRVFGQQQHVGMANVDTGFNSLYQTTPGIYPGEPNYWGRPANNAEESSNANNIFANMAGGTGFDRYYRINASLYGIMKLYEGLSVEGMFNYAPIFRERSTYSRPNGYWDYVTDTRQSDTALSNASITNSTYKTFNINTELIMRYETTVAGDHEIGAMAGYTTNEYKYSSYSVSKRGATDWSLHDLSTFEELTNSTSSGVAKWAQRSYFGRVNYNYRGRYLFEANLRADGSSRFGPDSRWGIFPSFSAGWRISDEPFMEWSRTKLSGLKIRGSWGITGSNNLGNYDWQANYKTVNVVSEGNATTGLIQTKLGNYVLKWEESKTTDIGFDFALFASRLTGDIDYYHKITDGILHTPSMYLTMGNVSAATENLAKVRNSGLDITLNWRGQIGREFSYSVGGNFSLNANKVIRYKGKLEKYWMYDEEGNRTSYYNNFSDVAQSKNGGQITEGKRIGETYIRQVYKGTGAGYDGGIVDINAGPKDGMIRTEADMRWVRAMIDAGYSFYGMTTVSRDQLWYGDLIYKDLNGDRNYGNDHDREFTGHSIIPRYNAGLNLSMSWKNIDLYMLWTGSFGFHLIWGTAYYNTTQVNNGHGIAQRIADSHYFYNPDAPDDTRTNIDGKHTRLMLNTINNNAVASDWYEYRGDYVKLKNIQVGYTLPQNISRRFYVDKLRVYVSAENLLTITSYPGQDPEIGTSIGYPLMKQISFGVQVNF